MPSPTIIREETIFLKTEKFKVATNSKPNKVAGAIVGALKTSSVVELYAIGAGAVNQAIKAIAIAGTFSEDKLVCVPGFCDLDFDGQARTGIKITIKTA